MSVTSGSSGADRSSSGTTPLSKSKDPTSLRPTGRRIVTLRAVLLGGGLSILSCIWMTYSTYIGKSSSMPVAHLPVAALFPFILVALGLNPLLRKSGMARPLAFPELMVILFMLMAASMAPGWPFASYIVSLVSAPLYYATPENRWGDLLFPHLPEWLMVNNNGGTLAWFYEGLPADRLIPWGVWLAPLFWWSTLFIALFTVCACLMVLMRKQWVSSEKLAFPLVQAPIMLVQEDKDTPGWPKVFNQRLFWFGVALPLFIICWNILSYFQWMIPIPIGKDYITPVTLATGFPPMLIRMNWLVFGFAYFAPVDVLAGVWFFRLFNLVQEGILAQFGFNLTDSKAGVTSVTSAQHIGGFIFFILWSLWMARRHLRSAISSAVGLPSDADDRDELISYRSALIGLVLGLTYMLIWLTKVGMETWIAVILLVFVLLFYYGVTRIIAESGLVLLDLPLNPHDFTVSLVGSANMTSSSLTSLGLSSAFARNWRTFGMTLMAHVGKVSDGMRGEKRALFAVVFLSMGLSMTTSVFYTIYLGYETTGAAQFGGWTFTAGNRLFFDTIIRWMNNLTPTGITDMGFFGVGAAMMWMLIKLRYFFPGWPLHPVGFAIGSSFAVNQAFSSIFLAWFIKIILLKIGGLPLYKKAQPFFLGILVGFSIGVMLVFIVDTIWFPAQGHEIDNW